MDQWIHPVSGKPRNVSHKPPVYRAKTPGSRPSPTGGRRQSTTWGSVRRTRSALPPRRTARASRGDNRLRIWQMVVPVTPRRGACLRGARNPVLHGSWTASRGRSVTPRRSVMGSCNETLSVYSLDEERTRAYGTLSLAPGRPRTHGHRGGSHGGSDTPRTTVDRCPRGGCRRGSLQSGRDQPR